MPEVVSGGREDGIGGVAGLALEVAAAEVALLFHVPDKGLDGGSPPQLSLDGTEDTALLSGDEDAARLGRIVSAVSVVDVDPVDLATAEALDVLDDGPQGVAVVGITRQGCGVQNELAAGRSSIGGHDRDLYAELPRCAGLALADALDLRSVEGIELPTAF